MRVGDTDPIWNLYREAIGMLLGALVAALWGLSCPESQTLRAGGKITTIYLGSRVSLVSVMSWSMNWPQTTRSTVTAWSWKPSSYKHQHAT